MQFKILNTAIERILNSELANIGLTYTQATVIGYLKQNSGRDICQKDIEYSLGLTHPTVSSILSRMEEGGLIVTETLPTDRRYKKIIPTEEAISLSECIHDTIGKIKKQTFENITPEQEDILSSLVKKMIGNIS
ncbi:MAG: MarR family transcriptional regulator [Ruminococcus flavefaciens]|nr:MarR family transcriptional regulator [Ruminococcus flavefaciens]MCM1061147.1 MarR family transcriptional regulator [Eubacterium sp.]